MPNLSAHLQALCAFDVSVEEAANGLEKWLRRYGDVKRKGCLGFEESMKCLLPLASLPTRYVLVQGSEWTVVFNNSRTLAADELLVPLSKAADCRGTFGLWSDEGRRWIVAERGERVRAVVCISDGNKWVFHQEGQPLSFEDQNAYAKRRKRERLTAEAVKNYLAELVGVSFPLDWRSLLSREAVCLERSTKDVQVPIKEYVVDVDL